MFARLETLQTLPGRSRPIRLPSCKQDAPLSPFPASLTNTSHHYHSTALISPLFSHSCALFCSLQNAIARVFNRLRTLCEKQGGGGTFLFPNQKLLLKFLALAAVYGREKPLTPCNRNVLTLELAGRWRKWGGINGYTTNGTTYIGSRGLSGEVVRARRRPGATGSTGADGGEAGGNCAQDSGGGTAGAAL